MRIRHWEEREALRSLIDACVCQQGIMGASLRRPIGERGKNAKVKERIDWRKRDWEYACGRGGEQHGTVGGRDRIATGAGPGHACRLTPPPNPLLPLLRRQGRAQRAELYWHKHNRVISSSTRSQSVVGAHTLRGFSSMCVLFSSSLPSFVLSSHFFPSNN